MKILNFINILTSLIGYDQSSAPVQPTPRKVTSIKQPVKNVAISDKAMCVLVENGDVICFYNNSYTKITFNHFKSDSNLTKLRTPSILNIKASSNTFAALSSLGEVFIFASPNEITKQIKPQKVWSFRNHFTSIRDFDVGSNGAIIICTNSGTVYVKMSKNNSDSMPSTWKDSKKSSKFVRIPLHRVSNVFACDSG